MELEGIGHIHILGYRGIDGRYVFVRGSAHPPVVKNGGALRINRISSGPIIGGRPRAPRVHLLYRPLCWNPGMILLLDQWSSVI